MSITIPRKNLRDTVQSTIKNEESRLSPLDRWSRNLMLDSMHKDEDIMNEIFEFNVRDLEATPSVKISQFIIGLSQFLIYFSSQVNKTKVSLMQKRYMVDSYVFKSELKGRTKAEKYKKVIDAHPELQLIEIGIQNNEQELALVENREKYLVEFINALKRELTRRDQELKSVRDERRL